VRLKSKNAVSSTPQCDGVSGGRLDCLADFWFLRLDTQTEAASSSADIVGAWGRCSSLESAREAARREGWLEASEELESARREIADREAELQDLREELDATQRDLAEARAASQSRRQTVARDSAAERREIAALKDARDASQQRADALSGKVSHLSAQLERSSKLLEECRARAERAEAAAERSQAEARQEREARIGAEREARGAMEQRTAALKSAREAEARCAAAEEAAAAVRRRAEVSEANVSYLRAENARLKSEAKEAESRIRDLAERPEALEPAPVEESGSRAASGADPAGALGADGSVDSLTRTIRMLTKQLAQSKARELELAEQLRGQHSSGSSPRPGKDRGCFDAADGAVATAERSRVQALLEKSLMLWGDMHVMLDGLEAAERAAAKGMPRPAVVDRAVASARRWQEPPRAADLLSALQRDGGIGPSLEGTQVAAQGTQQAPNLPPIIRSTNSSPGMTSASQPIHHRQAYSSPSAERIMSKKESKEDRGCLRQPRQKHQASHTSHSSLTHRQRAAGSFTKETFGLRQLLGFPTSLGATAGGKGLSLP